MLKSLLPWRREKEPQHDEQRTELQRGAPPDPPKPSSERRRAPRMIFERDARLEIIGVTPREWGWSVRTRDISVWGVGIVSTEQLCDARDAVLVIDAPDGTTLRAVGKLINVRQLPGGEYTAALSFHDPQPRLAAA